MVRPLAFRERSHGSEAVSVNYATKKNSQIPCHTPGLRRYTLSVPLLTR
jgi:hypothetical protein